MHQPMHELKPADEAALARRSFLTPARVGIMAAVIAIAVAGAGIWSRNSADHRLAKAAQEAAVPSVSLVSPSRPDKAQGLVLPGSVHAFNNAPIYARTNGYVRRWLVDIGDPVKAGQPLAILDTPEIDAQLAAARADYQTALANEQLARSTAARWQSLLARDAVSRQEADEKQGDFAAKKAITSASLANVQRLEALSGFGQIRAPFAGVVTSRSAQIGALVSAGSAGAQPLFTVSDVHRIRVYVRVPQAYSAGLKAGQHASMELPEYPGRSFDLVLTRTAGAVDAQSGTVLVELQAANADHALKPGAYAQVSFAGIDQGAHFRVPATALIFRDTGMQVAMVGPDDKVVMRTIQVGRDEGKSVEVLSGLTGKERLIDNPPDSLEAGDTVRAGATRAQN